MLNVQNVSGQAGSAEEAGTAVKGWNAADIHEENEEAGAAIQRTSTAQCAVGQTRAGGSTGGVQE